MPRTRTLRYSLPGTGAKQHSKLRHRRGDYAEAHTARKLVGSSARKNGTLRWTVLVEVCRVAGSPKPPQERRVQSSSFSADTVPTEEGMQFSTSHLSKVCGEPVSRSATQPTGATAVCSGVDGDFGGNKKRRRAHPYPGRGRRRGRGRVPRALGTGRRQG